LELWQVLLIMFVVSIGVTIRGFMLDWSKDTIVGSLIFINIIVLIICIFLSFSGIS